MVAHGIRKPATRYRRLFFSPSPRAAGRHCLCFFHIDAGYDVADSLFTWASLISKSIWILHNILVKVRYWVLMVLGRIRTEEVRCLFSHLIFFISVANVFALRQSKGLRYFAFHRFTWQSFSSLIGVFIFIRLIPRTIPERRLPFHVIIAGSSHGGACAFVAFYAVIIIAKSVAYGLLFYYRQSAARHAVCLFDEIITVGLHNVAQRRQASPDADGAYVWWCLWVDEEA